MILKQGSTIKQTSLYLPAKNQNAIEKITPPSYTDEKPKSGREHRRMPGNAGSGLVRVSGSYQFNRTVPNIHYKDERIDVLNGIAYDHERDRIFVTGKLWPNIFEIKVLIKDQK